MRERGGEGRGKVKKTLKRITSQLLCCPPNLVVLLVGGGVGP